MKRLDPEVLGAHLGPLLRTASALCDSRESAEDLVQETVARVLSRPRLLRGGDERVYLMEALRKTFLTSRRTAARRPRVITSLEGLDPADRRTGALPEEAVIATGVGFGCATYAGDREPAVQSTLTAQRHRLCSSASHSGQPRTGREAGRRRRGRSIGLDRERVDLSDEARLDEADSQGRPDREAPTLQSGHEIDGP